MCQFLTQQVLLDVPAEVQCSEIRTQVGDASAVEPRTECYSEGLTKRGGRLEITFELPFNIPL